MESILITGGAGYKGVVLTEALLNEGYDVTILDNFMYGFEPVLGFCANPRCHFVRKDIRNIEEKDVKDFDIIYHLAGISGYPACEANPHSAQAINVNSTQRLVKLLSKNQILIYASTTSMYGRSGTEQDENSKPTPVSMYGVTKYKAEMITMQHPLAVSFRFATIYGVSRKMRNDLLVNDFVYRAVKERSLVLFEPDSVRTFLHLKDAIQAYLMVLKEPRKFTGQIFNVGSETMNFSKLDIAQKIKKFVKFEMIESRLDDPDKRDFHIKFDKMKNLGFQPTVSLEDGILELANLYQWYEPYSNFRTI